MRMLYRFGDAAFGFSPMYELSAPPAAGANVQFIAYGDLGQYQLDDTIQQVRMVWLLRQ
jgi:hypothetical protein